MDIKGIDLTQCNNCRYKAKVDGVDDYGRICVEDGGLAFLRSDREGYIASWHCDVREIMGISERKVLDFEIVPRDPETYKDWQVGDRVEGIVDDYDPNKEVVFRSGELVVCKTEQDFASENYLCNELFNNGYRLALTDIETRIIEEKDRKQKPYEFKKGEPVLVRIADDETWRLRSFMEHDASRKFPYVATDGIFEDNYMFCIPYNEKTMHLLGTTEDYKEE